MIENKYYSKGIFILIFLSYIFLMWGNGILNLTNPDEVFYAQTAKEMIQHKSWLTPYIFDQPHFEKPILTFWLFKAGFMLFGISNFTARFFPALFAIIGVVAVYLLGLLAFKEEKRAFLSGLILMSSGIYIGLARTVFTDMIFSILILLSLLSFFWGYAKNERKTAGLILFFIFSALAVLAKGPLGLIIPLLIIVSFLLAKKNMGFLFCKGFLAWGFLIFIAIALPWYVYMLNRYGHSFTQEFFYNDHIRRFLNAEHPGNDKWYFYPASIIGCIFPWSIFILCALIYLPKKLRQDNNSFYLFLICWIAVVLLIFQAAHSKLISYILPLFPALSIIMADFIYSFIADTEKRRLKFNPFLITVVIFLIIGTAMVVGSFLFLSRLADYVSSKPAIYILSLSWFILAVLFTILVIRHNYAKSVYLLPCFMLAFLGIFPFIVKDIEPFVSSKYICTYLLKNYEYKGTILCSNPFVRGVRYYTDNPVVAYGSNFFSPHPIPRVDSDDKVIEFLRKQPITFAVLTKPKTRDIARMLDSQKDFKYTLFKIPGSEYLMKISHGE